VRVCALQVHVRVCLCYTQQGMLTEIKMKNNDIPTVRATAGLYKIKAEAPDNGETSPIFNGDFSVT